MSHSLFQHLSQAYRSRSSCSDITGPANASLANIFPSTILEKSSSLVADLQGLQAHGTKKKQEVEAFGGYVMFWTLHSEHWV